MKVLILQEIIPIYRKRLFDFFASRYPEIDVTVASTSLIANSPQITNLQFRQFAVKKFRGFSIVKENLNDYIKEFDIVVVMFDIRWISFMSLLFGKRNSRILLWGHGYSNNSSGFILKIRRFLALKSNGIIFYDDNRKELFSNTSVLKNKSFTAVNTLVVKNHGISTVTKRNSILFVGRINRQKQVIDLLRAFILIIKDIPNDIDLVIVGDGEYKKELLDEAGKTNRSNIRILNAVYDEEQIKALYDNALVSVIPGTVGLGIVTSFAYGVPILYAKERFHGPEIKYANENNSYQYDGTVEDLAKVLLNIIKFDNKVDKNIHAYNYYKENLLPELWADQFKQACFLDF